VAHRNKSRNGNSAATQTPNSESPKTSVAVNEPPATPTPGPLGRVRGEIGSLFDRWFGHWPMPAEWGWDVDVEETENEIRVRAEIPGFEAKEIDVQVTGNILTVRAERETAAEEQEGGVRSWERRHSRFQRSFTLPAPVDADKVVAKYRNGVLELQLPRTEAAQRKRIEVQG
jgi:HSP20 family protein